MKILISEKLSEHKYKTPEGYLVCVDSILARTGKQTYRRNELFHDGDDTEVEVDRTPEEVFSEATLASFENKPVTVEHPNEDVNINNYKEYAVGFVRDVKQGKVDGQDVILGTLVITDAQTIEEIENGEHTELSCGYDCDILDEDNPTQRNIRGNHVALCEQGRAGIAKIVDSVKINDYWTIEAGKTYKAKSGATIKVISVLSGISEYNGSPWLNIIYDWKSASGKRSGRSNCNARDFFTMMTDKTLTGDSVNDYSDITISVNSRVEVTDITNLFQKIYDQFMFDTTDLAFGGLYLGKKKSKNSILLHIDMHRLSKRNDEKLIVGVGCSIGRYNSNEEKSWSFHSIKEAVSNAQMLANKMNELYSNIKNPKDSVNDAMYCVEFSENGQVFKTWIEARDEKEAQVFVLYSNPKAKIRNVYKDSIDDSLVKDKNRLPAKDRKFISNYLRMISTYTSRDVDIRDLLRPLSGHSYNWTIEKIEGWKWKQGEYAYKNYYVSINGYDDKFLVTLYADPNQDWKVKEVNAYFTDSVNDSTYKCEFKLNGDTMWTYVKADSPEDAKRELLDKFASAKEISVTGHDSVEDTINDDARLVKERKVTRRDVEQMIQATTSHGMIVLGYGEKSVYCQILRSSSGTFEFNIGYSNYNDGKMKTVKTLKFSTFKEASNKSQEIADYMNRLYTSPRDSVEDKDMSVEEYLELMEQGDAERVYRNAHGNPNAEKAYRKYKGLDNSVDDSDGHEIVRYVENYLSELGKNNSTGKYDRIVHGVKSILKQGFLKGEELKKAARQETDRLLKKYALDSAMKVVKIVQVKGGK